MGERTEVSFLLLLSPLITIVVFVVVVDVFVVVVVNIMLIFESRTMVSERTFRSPKKV